MTKCCCPSLSTAKNGSHWQYLCPQNRAKGTPVKLITLKSLLVPIALEQLDVASAYGFCPSNNCPVVYFSEQGQTFTTADLKVPVFQKNGNEDVSVCYCFGWSRQRIYKELQHSKKSDVVGMIVAHVKAKRCGCEVNNPQGSCCLNNVRLVVQQSMEELTSNGAT
jgi:hypothetical protein